MIKYFETLVLALIVKYLVEAQELFFEAHPFEQLLLLIVIAFLEVL